jgi:drug/metabolite transporter superfamily protein YnfA
MSVEGNNEEVNMKEKKTTGRAPRYDVEYLKPKKGKSFYHVIATTILLFVVTIIYTYVDYNITFSFIRSMKLFGGIFLLSSAVWGIAYLFNKYISRKL